MSVPHSSSQTNPHVVAEKHAASTATAAKTYVSSVNLVKPLATYYYCRADYLISTKKTTVTSGAGTTFSQTTHATAKEFLEAATKPQSEVAATIISNAIAIFSTTSKGLEPATKTRYEQCALF